MIWPLPALLAWAAAWAVFITTRGVGVPAAVAVVLATALGLIGALFAATKWRRVFVAAGFPLSLLASGAAALPAWAWLLPLGLLALLYPINTWRDAPMFPTPTDALKGLARRVPLPGAPRILDAGCGLGDGLRELKREYASASLHGLEWSWPLRIACAWRCRVAGVPATVKRADIWAAPWSGFDMVYLFQRPESMQRAADKAARELLPGGWLASLEFEVPSLAPDQRLDCADGRRVWLYKVPFTAR